VTPFLSELSPQTIAEDQVSVARLSDVLQSAFLDHEIDNGDLYISDDGVEYPFWVAVAEEPKLVEFFTYFTPEKPAPVDWLKRVNDLNGTIRVPQFSFQRDAVWGRYWMTYEGGLSVRHFIKMVRRFSGAFRVAVNESISKGAAVTAEEDSSESKFPPV
jgi:hypothetical protein